MTDQLQRRMTADAHSFESGYDAERIARLAGSRQRRSAAARVGATVLVLVVSVGLVSRIVQDDQTSGVAVSSPVSDVDLFEAIELEDADVVESFLAGGGNPNVAIEGRSALEFAALRGNTDAIDALVASGANVDGTVETDSPLVLAAQVGRVAAVEALLVAGADPDARSSARQGLTALLFAVEEGDQRMVTSLLDGGADPNLKANDGTSALQLAFAGDPEVVVPLLLDAGADAASPTPWGSLAELAREEGFPALGTRLEAAAGGS